MKIALGAAIGLEFLHEKAQPCVILTGIRSSNIFLFDNDVAKIGYPGLSRQAPDYIDNIFLDRPNGPQGTSFVYDAPEYATKCFTSVRFFQQVWKIIRLLLILSFVLSGMQ